MRRLSAIFLLFLILLNTLGFYNVLLLIEKEAFRKSVTKINDTDHEISGNLLLRIPMVWPDQKNDEEYRKVNGQIEVDGEIYHYVKEKFYNDTLFIVCLRDDQTTKIKNTISDFSKLFSAQSPESERNTESFLLSFAKFYLLWKPGNDSSLCSWIQTISFSQSADLYSFLHLETVFHPPCC